MQIPNRANAFIHPDKLTKYLLSQTHTIGKAKAKFFRKLGFNETNTRFLENQLLKVAKMYSVTEVVETIHGSKYVVIGSIATPSSGSATILTVWIIDQGKTAPRFVTARPYKKSNL